jgi:hypothetical protein
MTHRHIETGHLINGEVSNLKSLVITVDISTLKDSCRSVYINHGSRFKHLLATFSARQKVFTTPSSVQNNKCH